jgi:hypothetical protein
VKNLKEQLQVLESSVKINLLLCSLASLAILWQMSRSLQISEEKYVIFLSLNYQSRSVFAFVVV